MLKLQRHRAENQSRLFYPACPEKVAKPASATKLILLREDNIAMQTRLRLCIETDLHQVLAWQIYRTKKLQTDNNNTGPVFRAELKFTVTGDLRFSSHHDMMRAIERCVSRAGVCLRYTQGFNPRPVMSLSVPRPVGVVSHDDRLVVAFDSPVDLDQIIAKLNTQCPLGLSFESARVLKSKTPPQPAGVCYELNLSQDEIPLVSQKLEALNAQQNWLVERPMKSRRNSRREEPRMKSVDLKPRLCDFKLTGATVSFTCVEVEGSWAKPREILALIGLGDIANVARLTRTRILDRD